MSHEQWGENGRDFGNTTLKVSLNDLWWSGGS